MEGRARGERMHGEERRVWQRQWREHRSAHASVCVCVCVYVCVCVTRGAFHAPSSTFGVAFPGAGCAGMRARTTTHFR